MQMRSNKYSLCVFDQVKRYFIGDLPQPLAQPIIARRVTAGVSQRLMGREGWF